MTSQLYTPVFIGNVKIKNRLMMPAMNLSYAARDGCVTQRLLDFYRARAMGGAGLIVVGAVGVDPGYISPAGVLQLCDDAFVNGMSDLAAAIHGGGAKCFVQLWHPGAYARQSEYGKAAVAPSAAASGFTRETPRELSVYDIKRICKLFGQAAERARQAGFDGVELCGNSGYLISQFLSSKTNKRDDIYGGPSVSERFRFLREVIASVRKSAGTDFPIMVRLAGNEFVSGGNGIADCVEIAQALEKQSVAALSITGGWHETSVPQLTMDVPAGAYVYLARLVKRAVSIPVCACNRLDAKAAEKAVDDADADMAGVGRGFIADPNFGQKAMTGQYSLIRPCIGCNQSCMDNIFRMKPLGCLVNPEVCGDEDTAPALVKKRILVIGAGPAGLEFARLAALRGHSVTVREKDAKTGGLLRLAAAAPGRADFLRLADYLTNACITAGVKINLGVRMDGSAISAALRSEFDHVVIATGSKPSPAPFPVSSEAEVYTARQVLSGTVNPGRRVLIVGSRATAVETALYLAETGTVSAPVLKFLTEHRAEAPELLRDLLTKGNREISLLVRHDKIGLDIGPSTRWSRLAALERRHVGIVRIDEVVLVDEGWVKVRIGGTVERIACDSVVLATGSESLIPEFDEDAFAGRVTVIGDAEAVGKLDTAILSAHKAAAEIA